MKRALVFLLVCCIALSAFTLSSGAAVSGAVVPNYLSPSDGKYSVSYNQATVGQQYMLFVFSGFYTSVTGISITADNILYTDFGIATSSVISFNNFIPRVVTVSTVVISGGNLSSPLIIAYIQGGVSVKGRIKSYDPKIAAQLSLIKSGEVKYTQSMSAVSGSGQVSQDFVFTGVESGTYTLLVTKEGHTSYTVNNVVVGDAEVDLTTNIRPEISLVTLRGGDLNSDGVTTMDDLLILLSSSNYNKTIINAANKKTDINGDGFVTMDDLLLLLSASNYNKGQVVIDF